LKRKEFLQRNANFSFRCLYISKEVLDTMINIKLECVNVAEKELIFLVEYTKTYYVTDFKQIQRTAFLGTKQRLTKVWLENIEAQIRRNLNKIGKGWYNMHETNTETYEFSKLKKFLSIVKYMMQEAL